MNTLIPAIIQDSKTSKVLMLGYMNEEALQKTRKTKTVWFYSRSKRRLWKKGEMSGNVLNVSEILTDCDQDALLIKVRPKGPTCHTGSDTCFKEQNRGDAITELFSVIEDRKKTMPKGSYTALLFKQGLSKICAKIAEESEEVIRAAKRESRKRLIEESVDLMYHLFVLLTKKRISLSALEKEILRRR